MQVLNTLICIFATIYTFSRVFILSKKKRKKERRDASDIKKLVSGYYT